MSSKINTSNKLKRLVDKYTLFLKDVSVSEKQLRGYNTIRMMKPLSRGYIYFGWNTEALTDAVTELSVLCPYIGDRGLQDALSYLMSDLFGEKIANDSIEENIEYKFESLIDILDVSDLEERMRQIIEKTNQLAMDFTVCIPIEGVTTLLDDLNVRGIALYSSNNLLIASFIEDQDVDDKDTKPVDCYGLIDIYGDMDYAAKKGVEIATEAIKILNFHLSSPIHRPKWSQITIGKRVFCRPKDKREEGLQMGWHYLDFKPQKLLIEPGQKGMIKWYESLINRRSKNEITQRVLRSIDWYSKAVDAYSLEESFVNLSIALESLLINDNEDNSRVTSASITQKLRERVAFLLEDTIDGRKKVAKLTANLYGERSGIVHNGKPIDRQKLIQLSNIVKKTIDAMLTKEFDTWQAFLDWIDEKRYG